MARLPDDIRQFMQAHNVRDDEVWAVPGGRAYAVKHKALERIANERGIWFDPPNIIQADALSKVAVLWVKGHAEIGGEEVEAWSIGEAAPDNCKNAYPFAMAEKRARDRVILKLLSAHGSLYSEDEADDFKEPASPPPPKAAPKTAQAPQTEAAPEVDFRPFNPEIVAALKLAFRLARTLDSLKQANTDNADAINQLNDEDYREIQGAFLDRKGALLKGLVSA